MVTKVNRKSMCNLAIQMNMKFEHKKKDDNTEKEKPNRSHTN